MTNAIHTWQSVVGPVLFNAYIVPLTNLIVRQDIQYHLCANDTQLYVDFQPASHADAVVRMMVCIREVKTWLCGNGLVLKDANIHSTCGKHVATSITVRDLGVVIDTDLSMASQVANV